MGKHIIYLGLGIILLATTGGIAQDTRTPPLFQDQSPLSIRLSISFRDLRRQTNDSTYIPSTLSFKVGEVWDTIPIDIRTRGNFRKKNCTYPPLRIKFKKNEVAGTLFEGTKSVKVVIPCHEGKSSMELINKEYLCYQLYHPVTDFHLKTRLLDIMLIEEKGKQEKISHVNGFFIEDDDQLAERNSARVVDAERINPLQLEDTSALRFDFFQYMIANTDFSTTVVHNAEVLLTEKGRYIAVPYDFDMTGIVNAPYATVDPKWEIEKVTQRAYKGYCRNEKVAEYVRQEFISREEAIYQIIDRHTHLFYPKETESLKKYVGEFFRILKSDYDYSEKITAKCRRK